MATATIQPDDKKLKELILYIAQRCESDPAFGATKLNKVLFFSDFIAFRRFGKPITGHPYFKLPQGPAPRRMLPILKQLEKDGSFKNVERWVGAYQVKKPTSLREPNLAGFSAEEIAIVDEMIAQCAAMTAKQVSDFSHQFIGWQVANAEEDIPYGTAWVRPRPLEQNEIEMGRTIATKVGGKLLAK